MVPKCRFVMNARIQNAGKLQTAHFPMSGATHTPRFSVIIGPYIRIYKATCIYNTHAYVYVYTHTCRWHHIYSVVIYCHEMFANMMIILTPEAQIG